MTYELKDAIFQATYEPRRDCLLEKAEAGDVEAMYELAVLYHAVDEEDGLNPEAKAHRWFVKAAEAGWADAVFFLGVFHENPWGFDVVEHDMDKAVEYYNKAIEMGSNIAKYEMGWRYLQGWKNVEQDVPKGLQLLEQAAEAKDYQACERLFNYYKHIAKDYEKAMQYAGQTISILRDLAIEI